MKIGAETKPRNTPRDAWYLLPILCGIVGGAIMWACCRLQDPIMATKGLILGFGVTMIGFASWAVVMTTINMLP